LDHPFVAEFDEIYRTYKNSGYNLFRNNIIRNILIWCFFILPIGIIFFANGTVRLVFWESIFTQIIYWVAQYYFAPRLHDLHAKLLPWTKSEYAEGYYRDTNRMLRAVYKEKSVLVYILNWMLNRKERPSETNDNLKKLERIEYLSSPRFFILIGLFYLGFLGAIFIFTGNSVEELPVPNIYANFFQSIMIWGGIFIILVNLIPITLLLFANMKVLHHVSFWEYDSGNEEDLKPLKYRFIGDLLIENNFFCSVIVFSTGFLLAPIALCFGVLLYSSTYPRNYYQYASRKGKRINIFNIILNIGFMMSLWGFFIISPDSAQNFIQNWLHNSFYLPVYLPAGFIVIIGVLLVFQTFIMGYFQLPKDFRESPVFFRPLGSPNSRITLNRIIFYGLFLFYSIALILGVIVNGFREFSWDSAIFRIILYAVICFLVVRAVITSMRLVWQSCEQIGTLMLKYTWKHKQEELLVHYWEFINSPTGLVFPGVLTMPMYIFLDKIFTARTFFLTYPSWLQSMALIWFVLCISILGYLVGVVVFWTILAPHFVWHSLALTTIPKNEIPIVQNLPIFAEFRQRLQSLYEWGFIGLTGLFLIFIPTVTGIFNPLVIFSMIMLFLAMLIGHWAIAYFLPRFLSNILHPIEQRTEETIESDYGKKKK
jgi:hypothetical protein